MDRMNAVFLRRSGCSTLSARIRVPEDELIPLLWQLDSAVGAGMPMPRALDLVVRHLDGGPAKDLAVRLSENISVGIPLSIALDRSLEGPSRLVYAAVSLGETAGRLDLAFAFLRHAYELQLGWWSSFESWVITRPRLFWTFWGILLLASGQASLEQIEDPLYVPGPSRILTVLETFAGLLGDPLVWALIGLLCAWYHVWLGRGGAGFMSLARNLIRRLPCIGRMIENRLAARSLRLLAFVLETGSPPLVAAAVIADGADHRDVRRVFRSSCEILRNGGSFSAAFATSGLLPERAIRGIATGEDLGTLPETVGWLAASYEAQVSRESAAVGTLFTIGMVLGQLFLLGVIITSGFSPSMLLSGI